MDEADILFAACTSGLAGEMTETVWPPCRVCSSGTLLEYSRSGIDVLAPRDRGSCRASRRFGREAFTAVGRKSSVPAWHGMETRFSVPTGGPRTVSLASILAGGQRLWRTRREHRYPRFWRMCYTRQASKTPPSLRTLRMHSGGGGLARGRTMMITPQVHSKCMRTWWVQGLLSPKTLDFMMRNICPATSRRLGSGPAQLCRTNR